MRCIVISCCVWMLAKDQRYNDQITPSGASFIKRHRARALRLLKSALDILGSCTRSLRRVVSFVAVGSSILRLWRRPTSPIFVGRRKFVRRWLTKLVAWQGKRRTISRPEPASTRHTPKSPSISSRASHSHMGLLAQHISCSIHQCRQVSVPSRSSTWCGNWTRHPCSHT
jgi:hypothetical protein